MKHITTIICLFLINYSSGMFNCTLKGEIFYRQSNLMFLKPASQNNQYFKNTSQKVTIKVVNNTFDFSFSYTENELYELIFEEEFNAGSWASIKFFPHNGVVQFKLYPKNEFSKNQVSGGDFNAIYNKFMNDRETLFYKRRNKIFQSRDSLLKIDKLESLQYKEVLKSLRAMKSNDHEAKIPIYQKMDEMDKTHERFTEQAKELFLLPYETLIKDEMTWKYEYIKLNKSIVSLYLLWSDAQFELENKPFIGPLILDVFKEYLDLYPNHSYTVSTQKRLETFHSITIGNKYKDFKAVSIKGDTLTLSKIIKGKITLLDFWGSWCGPCIAKSRKVVPLYQKYNEAGFEVIGIAREFESINALKERLLKEQFNWIHLYDIDDQLKIWNLYGIGNGVGLMILINQDGKILAIDPNAEELEVILSSHLK